MISFSCIANEYSEIAQARSLAAWYLVNEFQGVDEWLRAI
jgi:hypothetical protein